MSGSESERADAEPPEAMAARVRASFERQAMMGTLGVRMSAVERGRVELAVDHDDRFTQRMPLQALILDSRSHDLD